MNARDKRFRKFVENHPFFDVTNFDPAKFWEVVRERQLPPRIVEDFEAAELVHKAYISEIRRVSGSKGGRVAGRGREKKKTA